MSQNITLNDTNYTGITKIKALKTGSSNYAEFVDTSDANAVASEIASGKTAYVGGSKITGTHSCSASPILQEKTVTSNGEVTPDSGYDGLSKVTVNVPSSGGSDVAAALLKRGLGLSGTVTIPSDATALPLFALEDSTATKVVLPSGLTHWLPLITNSHSVVEVDSLPTGLIFQGAIAATYPFTKIKLNCNSVSFTPSSSVTLSDYIFYQADTTSLTTINIGSNITSIGINAFANCANVTDIYIDKTEAECSSFASKAPFGATNATIHYKEA